MFQITTPKNTHLHMAVKFIRNGNIIAGREALRVIEDLACRGIYNHTDVTYFNTYIHNMEQEAVFLSDYGKDSEAAQMRDEANAWKQVSNAVMHGIRSRAR